MPDDDHSTLPPALQTIINVPLHELSYTSGDLSLLEEPEPAGKPAAEKAEQAAEGDAAADGPPACENKWERKTDDLSLRRERMKSSNKTYMTFRSGIEDQRKPTLKEVMRTVFCLRLILQANWLKNPWSSSIEHGTFVLFPPSCSAPQTVFANVYMAGKWCVTRTRDATLPTGVAPLSA